MQRGKANYHQRGQRHKATSALCYYRFWAVRWILYVCQHTEQLAKALCTRNNKIKISLFWIYCLTVHGVWGWVGVWKTSDLRPCGTPNFFLYALWWNLCNHFPWCLMLFHFGGKMGYILDIRCVFVRPRTKKYLGFGTILLDIARKHTV